uniref:Uncharacterized protein n=1 Tax=Desulfatirhabdium butyrativorans TaxID=340467 RepID=A0A7C4MPA6_9BACT
MKMAARYLSLVTRHAFSQFGAEMERCPVCNAKYAGKRQCHRCKADLGRIEDTESAAGIFLQQAVSAYAAGDPPAMLEAAERSCSLHTTVKSLRMLACASLLNRRFDQAMRYRNRLKRVLS